MFEETCLPEVSGSKDAMMRSRLLPLVHFEQLQDGEDDVIDVAEA
jgi:hypothetical protein